MCQKLCQVIPMLLMSLNGCGSGNNGVLEEVSEKFIWSNPART